MIPESDIIFALTDNDNNLIKSAILDGQFDINTRFHTSKQTILHMAIIAHNTSLIDFLLSHNADIDAEDINGITPLGLATCIPLKNQILTTLLYHIKETSKAEDIIKALYLSKTSIDNKILYRLISFSNWRIPVTIIDICIKRVD